MFCTYWMIWPCGVFWYYCVSDVFGFLKENRTHLWPGLVWSIILFLLWRSFPNVIYCDLPVICNKLTFLLYLFPCFKCFLHLWKSWSRFDCCLAWILKIWWRLESIPCVTTVSASVINDSANYFCGCFSFWFYCGYKILLISSAYMAAVH